jgi:SPP1 gp7 family putative phage head morphogenesis protein
MKREVKGSGTVTSPEPLKSVEREFANAIEYMVEQMRTRFRNQAIDALNQSTVEKFATEDSARALESAGYQFADAQIGNFANVFLGLAEKVRRKLLKQFDDKRLEKLAKQYTGKVNRRNQDEFYRRVQKRIGISKEELEATEGLTFQINAYQLETYQWLRKMRDDTMQQWTSQTLRLMAEGKGLPEILSQFDDMVEKRKNHAKMVARTQISTFNSLVTKARARNLGIERAVWVTSRDERVRRCHQVRDGEEFDLSEGLYSSCDGETLLPGIDYQCRCTYRLVIPSAEEEADNG